MKTEDSEKYLQQHVDDGQKSWMGALHPTHPSLSTGKSALLDLFFMLMMVGILLYAVSGQFFTTSTDAAKYQCYALAFWGGASALQHLPDTQCAFMHLPQQAPATLTQATLLREMQQASMPDWLVHFVAAQSSSQPYQALPHEYPLLTVPFFSLGLLAQTYWYQVAFALWMALVAIVVYLLLRSQSQGAALAFALYLSLGSWVTALGRFDLIPSALTLLALLCAERTRWKWAFVLLGLATMAKFYPAALLLPFLVAQQQQTHGPWYAWQRYAPLAIFALLCTVLLCISLALNVEGTLAAFSYFSYRPIQVESFAASVLQVLSMLSGHQLQYVFSFGSRNVVSPWSNAVSLGNTLLLIGGLVSIGWLQWQRKLSLAVATVLTLLIIILMGKVFSAQYLIWVTPIVAYLGRLQWKWLVGWGSICLVTTIIYPFLYNRGRYPFGSLLPDFYITVLVRNILLCGFICFLFYRALRTRPKVNSI